MKIAFHNCGGFTPRWIEYCKDNNIPYKIVNAYDNDIVSQISDCDAFMWHHHHADYRDVLFAKQLLYSLQIAGKKVFPDFTTGWHFDDKLGQKYLLEAIGAPLVPSYAFYTKKEALDWIKSTTFPKVFKLRGGAGASNVSLVHSKKQAVPLVNKAFGRGFSQTNRIRRFSDEYESFIRGNSSYYSLFKAFLRLFVQTPFAKMHSNEKGYVYFQDFIPNNDSDTRIVVIGDKIIGERRGCRKGDFRASGSNILMPDINKVDINCVKIAYKVSRKLKLQNGVFDFVHDEQDNPLIVEISYGTSPDYTECEGYWDEHFVFHKCPIDLPALIIEDFISQSGNTIKKMIDSKH